MWCNCAPLTEDPIHSVWIFLVQTFRYGFRCCNIKVLVPKEFGLFSHCLPLLATGSLPRIMVSASSPPHFRDLSFLLLASLLHFQEDLVEFPVSSCYECCWTLLSDWLRCGTKCGLSTSLTYFYLGEQGCVATWLIKVMGEYKVCALLSLGEQKSPVSVFIFLFLI